jgi:disulfide bond formation protein DsbB
MKKHETKEYRDHLRDERIHMENILNMRINFFVSVFGFIIASLGFIKNIELLKLVLILGFFIELVFTLVIGRANRRLQINMELLDEIKDDPSTDIKKIAKKGCCVNPFNYSQVNWMAYAMPISITILLLFSIIYSNELFQLLIKTSTN